VDPRRPLTTGTFADLAARLHNAPARLGGVRLVCVDGPAGSGKTTFADRLCAALGGDAVLVHLEELYAGWTLTGAAGRLQAGVLRPLSEGRAGAFHRYDWASGRFDTDRTRVRPAPVLVVEGCGSSPRALDPWTTLRIWVEAPAGLRVARGLARDGAAVEPRWRRWQVTEAAEFVREGTRARAELRVDGAPVAPLTDGRFALLHDTSP
jgi:uridine kinase